MTMANTHIAGSKMSTHADRILEFVTRFPGRDDDEISNLLAIRPRQTVNQICRALEAAGQVRRAQGPLGKIANFPVDGQSDGESALRAIAEPDLDDETTAAKGERTQITKEEA